MVIQNLAFGGLCKHLNTLLMVEVDGYCKTCVKRPLSKIPKFGFQY